MTYQPVTCVWEVTMGCNMRCKHCGSSCADPLPGELSTAEALDAVDQMAGLGLKWVTLSGGEPLTRKDLPVLVAALSRKGITPNIITNGWLVSPELAKTLAGNGIATAAVSVDGTREVHDRIRKPGSYDRLKESFHILRSEGINCGAVTTISKENIAILPDIKKELTGMGVSSWQVQLGLPMGNFASRPGWVLDPAQIDDVLDFCYETNAGGEIVMYPADCLGYYSHKELRARQMAFNTPGYQLWDGCNAGVRGFGLLHNGDILGCTSIRDREYVEGNIKERPLREIWEDDNAFRWRREMKKENLGGHCKTCKYGGKCLGGCPNTRLTINGTIYSENQYCSYNLALKCSEREIKALTDAGELFEAAQYAAKTREYQLCSQQLERLLELDGDNVEAWRLKGFSDFMNGNYDLSGAANRKALDVNPADWYAKKGLGLALFWQGKREEGLRLVEAAAKEAPEDAGVMQDLAALHYQTQGGRRNDRADGGAGFV
jgi:radical SAM protein with 4Fe4S-binding SPASM domain